MNPNVVLIVLDTLREDCSDGLSELLDYKFVRYQNTIAPAPWTIPSHASLFTGLMPSAHRIHESKGLNYNQICEISKRELSRGSLTRSLEGLGYTSYGLVCNPFLGEDFGYDFGQSIEFDRFGRDPVKTKRYRRGREYQKLGKMIVGAKTGLLKTEVTERVQRAFGNFPLEKGSKYILKWIKHNSLQRPFFLFVNLMEAHGPYAWHDFYRNWGQRVVYSYLTNRQFSEKPGWESLYPRCARFAVDRGLSLIERLSQELPDSLVIVTSDHGQLIGERRRYDHNYFLDDELLRVPLWVRYPDGVSNPKLSGTYISLTEIPKLVEGVVERREFKLGTDVAMAESFGPHTDLAFMGKNEEERKQLEQSFFRRVKIFTRKGSIVFNDKTGQFEEPMGAPSMTEAKAAITEVTRAYSVDESPVEFDRKDSEAIEDRLRDLGYL